MINTLFIVAFVVGLLAKASHAYEITSEQSDGYSIETELIEKCLRLARETLEKKKPQRAIPDAVYECIGIAAQDCMDRTDYSTYGMIMCLDAETVFWDRMLDQNYSDLAEWAEKLHGHVPQDDHAFKWTAPETLKKMQAEWKVYSNAVCRFRASDYWGGTAAGPTRGACWMRGTAEQALKMEREILGICSWQQGSIIREICETRGVAEQ
ncbi:lysozyme inhibitor LprI family protein [Ruegeria atlantica]|uniref:lysozyme inhibitor LprI family protein n=1 Tax=Ruegeria atlantica TaxID=81569 RepID=UPI00147C416F|nr:lysozyme inhibitor LprI family protein [Ruegeria atlantica]